MRILFASHNFRLPAELSDGYAGVDIEAVLPNWTDAIDRIRETVEEDAQTIDAVFVSADLSGARDRAAGLTLEDALRQMRTMAPSLRIIVSTASATALPEAQAIGAELFVAHDPDALAANLAAKLDLMVKSEAAHIVAVTGLQGGAGRTFVAQNLASALARRMPSKNASQRRVLLWEGDIKHGSLGYTYDLFPINLLEDGRRTVSRLIGADMKIGNIAQLKSAVIHEGSSLEFDVLLAPYGIREALTLYSSYDNILLLREQLQTILSTAQMAYDAVIIDLGTDLFSDPMPMLALKAADAIVSVATPSPAGTASLAAMREISEMLRAERRTTHVINRARHGIDAERYERFLIDQFPPDQQPLLIREDNSAMNVWDDLAKRVTGAK